MTKSVATRGPCDSRTGNEEKNGRAIKGIVQDKQEKGDNYKLMLNVEVLQSATIRNP